MAGVRSRADASVARVIAFAWTLLKARGAIFLAGLILIFINRAATLVLPGMTRLLVDDVVIRRQMYKLLWAIGLIAASILVQALTSWWLAYILSKGGQRAIAELRARLQAHVGQLPIAFYDANRTGTLISRIMSDVEGIRNLIGTGLLEFVGSVTTALLAFVLLSRINLRITLVTALLVCLFVLGIARILKVLWPIYDQRSSTVADVTGRLGESLNGIRVVKGFAAEGFEAQAFVEGVNRVLSVLTRAIDAEASLTILSEITVGLIGLWVVYAGIHLVLQGAISLGEYLTYTVLLAYVVAPLTTAVTTGMQLAEAIVGIDRSMRLLELEREGDSSSRAVWIGDIQGRIVYDHVSFSYIPEETVLHDISFTASPNEITALVGPSGSGKSTLISLLCAFYAPDTGRITIDGVDLSTLKLSSYRQQLGVVFQETFLFHGTIRENIAYSKPHISDAQIRAACRAARVDEFVERFPQRYDTVIGERGVTLSGGQRQRLSIARALVADPRILILDEATSNLDSESEQMIQEALSALMSGRTTIVIAHRLSTIRRADQILVLSNGRILDRGSHQELYRRSTRYRDLYDRQHFCSEII